ncbi:hypothetical protein LEMLEM_LOCUS18859 [Lemmus lemmus]
MQDLSCHSLDNTLVAVFTMLREAGDILPREAGHPQERATLTKLGLVQRPICTSALVPGSSFGGLAVPVLCKSRQDRNSGDSSCSGRSEAALPVQSHWKQRTGADLPPFVLHLPRSTPDAPGRSIRDRASARMTAIVMWDQKRV